MTIISSRARLADSKFLFERKGSVTVLLDRGEDFDPRLERLVEAAFEAEAEDFDESSSSEDAVEVKVSLICHMWYLADAPRQFTCPPSALSKVTNAVMAPGLCRELINSELIYAPNEPGEAPDDETETRIADLVEALEENEDTLRVWTTLDN